MFLPIRRQGETKMTLDKISPVTRKETARAESPAKSAEIRRVDTNSSDKPETSSITVSLRSRAAIKAYRLASEMKPDLGRAARVGAIKFAVANGTYQSDSIDVADAVIRSAGRG